MDPAFSLNNAPSELVANHLHIDLLAHAVPKAADEVLVDPWLEFAHPEESNQS